MSFSPSVVHLHEGFDIRNFPRNFSNQVYLSSLQSFEPYAYHSNFSIKFTLQGSETYIIDHQKRKLERHQVLIVNSGSYVEGFHDMTAERCRGLSVFLEPEIIREVYINQNTVLRGDVPESDQAGTAPLEFYDRIISDDEVLQRFLSAFCLQRSMDPVLEVSHYVELAEALVNFKLRFERTLLRTNKLKRSTQLEIVERVNRAKYFMNDSLHANFNLEAAARASCMSKYFLIRCFKNLTGLTPQQYHSLKRMEKAKEFLKKGLSVTETSVQMGYPNIFYFSRQFKRVTGNSPIQWQLRG